MRYTQGLPLTLNNICFEIREGEKVGIVGGAGAGKSSIIQALFRIYEPEVGSVYELCGYDALSQGPNLLKEKISIIPENPFLFKGSLKANLDPFELKSGSELWEALECANLKEPVEKVLIFLKIVAR